MSDFDKEAEREKLREKYGDESDERAATRQMSELLLKGATMTNQHCDTCGDPVFRYDGQEFCPTCQGQNGTDGDGQTSETESDEAAPAAESRATGTEAGTATTGGERPVEVDTPDTATEPEEAATGGERASADERQTPDTGRQQGESATAPVRGQSSEREERVPTSTPAPAPSSGTSDDLRAGRQSLERTLARFARAAEESDDPRAAREHLAAAREAAEALSALRR